MFSQIPKLS